MAKLIQNITPILLVLAGLLLMMFGSFAKKINIPSWLFLLFSFLLFNYLIAFYGGFMNELLSAWSPKKIPYFFVGLIIGIIPVGASFIWSLITGDAPSINYESITLTSLLVTLAIVIWEELWFRGIALEWGASSYGKIAVAVIFALLFLALHFLNPQINLLKNGTELFLAGYTLSIVYFVFGNIWTPIGMHFSNNFIGSLFEKGDSPSENYLLLYTLVLAALATFLTTILLKRN